MRRASRTPALDSIAQDVGEYGSMTRAKFIAMTNKVAREMDADMGYHEAVSIAMQLGCSKSDADLIARELGRDPRFG